MLTKKNLKHLSLYIYECDIINSPETNEDWFFPLFNILLNPIILCLIFWVVFNKALKQNVNKTFININFISKFVPNKYCEVIWRRKT